MPRSIATAARTRSILRSSTARGAAESSARARGGLGIVPARTQQHGYLWRRAISPKQLEERLTQVHRPYHEAIEAQLALLLERFGCALLLDCHSMPPPASAAPTVIFGDCRGKTADGWISAEAMAITARAGFEAGLNDPFAGGHVIDRHARPASGVHALQVEIDRRSYLDPRLQRPGAGFDKVAGLIETLAVELGQSLLGRQYATAAE